jgi:hypothetical protein
LPLLSQIKCLQQLQFGEIQYCSISKVAFDLFTDILSAVGLLSTGTTNVIENTLFFFVALSLYAIYTTVLIATGRNFSMSGINSGHHYLPTYQILMISDNVEFLPPIFYAMFWQPF